MTRFVSAPLNITEEFYSVVNQLNLEVGGKTIKEIQFSINRFTGKSSILYFTEIKVSGYVAFNGVCSLAKQKF